MKEQEGQLLMLMLLEVVCEQQNGQQRSMRQTQQLGQATELQVHEGLDNDVQATILLE